MRLALSASQCASSPSPSEDTMPMPVIQTSLAPADFGSVMRHRLQREADLAGHRVHVHAKGGVGEGGKAKGYFSAALQILAYVALCLRDRKAGTFVLDLRIDRQQLTGTDETSHLGFLHDGQERHALELQHAEQQPAGALGHRFGQEDAGHDWKAREMPLEDGGLLRDLRLDLDGALGEVEVEDTVDQYEIVEVHDRRLRARARVLGGDQFVDAIGEVFQHEVLLGRGLAVVDLLGPFFKRHFNSERLVDRKGDVEEVQAVDPQIVDGVALRLDRVARNVAGLSDNVGDLIVSGRHH